MSTPWRSTRRSTNPTGYSHHGRCKFGFNCKNFRKGKCTYFHPAEDQTKYAHSVERYKGLMDKGRKRWSLIVDGLSEGETLEEATPLSGHVGITGERVLGSFNKLGDNRIAVPGCPPQFSPPTAALQLKPDGDSSVPAVYPVYTYRLEPLIRSVQCMSPDVDVLDGTCDVVASAGSVYRLYDHLVRTTGMTKRVDVEVRSVPTIPDISRGGGGPPPTGVGRRVVLLQPWKDDPNHDISYGYGSNFAAATCHYPDDLPASLRGSFSHHRVLYYELGGLRIALHCEADGKYDQVEKAKSKSTTPWRDRGHLPSPPVSPKMAMSTPSSPPKTKGSRFSVLMEGVEDEDEEMSDVSSSTLSVEWPCGPSTPTSASHVVEIKTYDAAKPQIMADLGPKALARYVCCRPESQLYFGRTPQLYEAGHSNGTFEVNVGVQSVEDRLQQWEAENQQHLQRLVSFLRQIIQTASTHAAEGRTQLSLVLPGVQDPSCEDKRARLYVRHDGVSFLPA
ncbi:hypothetical protein Sste5346_005259 [Sporothrix stenoceras]|uniref:C3H1-type domain-containing protein n=1 Tax=Sporothrix stenoceras TaxID=5173 RepID=A0ABR3Z6K8_9PEZI